MRGLLRLCQRSLNPNRSRTINQTRSFLLRMKLLLSLKFLLKVKLQLSNPATDAVSEFQHAISAQPVFPQITTPATMPETTQTPIAPINKAPAPPWPNHNRNRAPYLLPRCKHPCTLLSLSR